VKAEPSPSSKNKKVRGEAVMQSEIAVGKRALRVSHLSLTDSPAHDDSILQLLRLDWLLPRRPRLLPRPPGNLASPPTGGASYTIPIAVPPGTAGMVPNLGRIDYTGNAAAGLLPYNSVRFTYATRPDITPLYDGGSFQHYNTTARLTSRLRQGERG